jgi:hypothetical protein
MLTIYQVVVLLITKLNQKKLEMSSEVWDWVKLARGCEHYITQPPAIGSHSPNLQQRCLNVCTLRDPTSNTVLQLPKSRETHPHMKYHMDEFSLCRN